ncbi:hypothetical protein B0T22DRAFT_443279 [Podospora appendiculata]|uniref:DUF3328 domain-containing protein n=1 Tax=Podospora appendiculata TaxID=314037 RepID=A0AAE1CB45_9PEZI|nr:hypothetical protein B0T22DRAFT_443279 [Podospora appendiculata]
MDKLSSDSSDSELGELLLDDSSESGHIRGSSWRWMPKNALGLSMLSLLVYIAVLFTVRVAAQLASGLSYQAIDTHFTLNIRVTPEDLDAIGENKTDRVQVNGGDYAAVLGVYHHIHCLNNLRRVVHWDYYGPRLAGGKHPEGFSKEHSNHCIDSLRQSLMCHPNTAVYTAQWQDDPHSPIRKDIKSDAVTTCVKWDSLDGWARPRALVPGNYFYLPGPYKSNRVAYEPKSSSGGA